MGCIPGPGYKRENEDEAYWAAGYRDGGLQCQGAIEINVDYAQMVNDPDSDYDEYGAPGILWWSEIDCGPIYEPYTPWDCMCGVTPFFCRNLTGGQVVHEVRY